MECPICIETYNKSTHRKITCFNCQKEMCVSCAKTFILSNATDAKCLHCNMAWDRKFMVTNFTRKFCNGEYKENRQNILKERVKCYFPSISDILTTENDLEDNREQQRHVQFQYKRNKFFLEENEYKIQNTMNEKKKFEKLHPDCTEEQVESYNTRCNTLLAEKSVLKNEKNEILKDIHHLEKLSKEIQYQIQRKKRHFVSNQKNTERNIVGRPCITENCRGFLNGKGNCPVCKRDTCMNCNIDITGQEGHECNESDIENWKVMQKNTKPCPSCRVRIFKISGCDQMWCTNCNTPFSWSKGTVETGPIHNPHYFDWIFQGGQPQPGQQGDDGICNENNLPSVDRIRAQFGSNRETNHRVLHYYRNIQHLRYQELRNLNVENNENTYRQGLYPHLYSLVKEGKGHAELERYDYRFNSDRELGLIITGYCQQQTHQFWALVNRTLDMNEFIEKYKKVRSHYHDAIDIFGKEYNRSFKRISNHL